MILRTFFVSSIAALGLSACVVKTTDTSDPAMAQAPAAGTSPAPATQPAPAAKPAPASPAPAPTASPAPAATAAAPVQPPYTPPPKPTTPPAEHALGAAVGSPPGMHAGAPETIWVWHDGDGMSWHVRTTTASLKDTHRFSGRIWTHTGKIETVTPYSLETQDRVRQEGAEGVTFDFLTGGAIDGFDFRANARSCLVFHLLVDQKPAEAKIEVGAKGEHPKAATFKICK